MLSASGGISFDLPLEVSGVRFRNPFFVSSGPTTMSLAQTRRIWETGWGAASLKLTIYPVPYINLRPRYGYYHSQGFLAFTAEKRLTLDELLKLIEDSRREVPDLVLFSNITYAGADIEGWVTLAKRCEDAGVHINELNFGCPNMSFNVEMTGGGAQKHDGPKTGASLGCDAVAVAEIVKAVRAGTGIPIFVKLSPEGSMMRYVAKAAIDAGAAAVGSNANRLAIVPVDLERPGASTNMLQSEMGLSCMSGPWALPLAKRDAYEIRKMVGPNAIITGTGGVTTWRDAVEMVMCGADLIGICTATLTHGFGILPEILGGFKRYMEEHGYRTVREMRDIVVNAIRSAPELTIYEGNAELREAGLAAPCVYACPAHVPAQGYVRAVADESFEVAWRLICSRNPLQSVCGKICDHPCEEACTRGSKDEPLRIRDIKDFVISHAREQGWVPAVERSRPRKERVAVVGAGPAGLAAAYDLARAGYQVTVFERHQQAGGALRSFIPRFRMGTEELEADIELIRSLGVEFRLGEAASAAFISGGFRKRGFSAVFVGTGAWAGIRPDIPGARASGALTAIEFLRDVGQRNGDLGGKRIGIVGGGFTAIDAARTCIRLGAAEVYVLYRRTRSEMPATPEEVTEAEEEGVKVMYLVAPREVIVRRGKVAGLRMVNHVLGEADETGRRRPETVEGTEFTLALDRIIFAVSQQAEEGSIGRLKMDGGFVRIDRATCRTNLKGVYAGGDCTGGRMDVIGAVADGKRAAAMIDRDIAGKKAVLRPEPELVQVNVDDVLRRKSDDPRRWRVPVSLRPAIRRRGDWAPYREAMTREQAVAEAQRCYACGCGAGCQVCQQLCNQFAWSLEGWQMQLDRDKCVGCGMCIWRCPNQNIVMKQTSDVPVVTTVGEH